MSNNLVALVKDKKAQIAKLQAELQEVRALLEAEAIDNVSVGENVRARLSKPPSTKRRGRPPKETPKRRRRRHESSVTWSEQILRDAGKPMTVTDLLRQIEERFHKKVQKDSLVSSLARKVKAREQFYRPEPSMYGLLEWKTKQTRAS